MSVTISPSQFLTILRFIPAHAGNTDGATGKGGCLAVHPRTRGEHPRCSRSRGSKDGSSPHTRGTQLAAVPLGLQHRFIPAHAGNTSTGRGSPSPWPVHPRTRGEHEQIAANVGGGTGSSPHTRGTPERRAAVASRLRFIPAHAGNTAIWPAASGAMPVHPRTRGEHIGMPTLDSEGSSVHPRTRGEHGDMASGVGRNAGSSPHTRGTPGSAPTPLLERRFIPAHAGNTTVGTVLVVSTPVHPRTRGEHLYDADFATDTTGSSPHTRGTRTISLWFGAICRFIPAHAEHGVLGQYVCPVAGSSPHTRGTLSGHLSRAGGNRFIPAHAGNTSRRRWPPT